MIRTKAVQAAKPLTEGDKVKLNTLDGRTTNAVIGKVTTFKPRGRPSSGKIVISLRLEPAVIQRFKATGPGWQARINDALKAAKIP